MVEFFDIADSSIAYRSITHLWIPPCLLWIPPCQAVFDRMRTCDRKQSVNRHSTVTHYQRPNMTHPQEGGTGGEVSEILFFSAKSKRRPSLIYSMQIIPVCLSIVARRKGVSATRRGGLNWTPISLLVGHPCKLFHTVKTQSTFGCLDICSHYNQFVFDLFHFKPQ